METIKTQVSAITQSVIDGKTSAMEAQELLIVIRELCNRGLRQISSKVKMEIESENEHDGIY